MFLGTHDLRPGWRNVRTMASVPGQISIPQNREGGHSQGDDYRSRLGNVLFVGFIIWFAVPQMLLQQTTLDAPRRVRTRAPATTVGTGIPTQREAISKAAKENPAGNEDASGARARDVKETTQATTVAREPR